jgi:hypothetical protein
VYATSYLGANLWIWQTDLTSAFKPTSEASLLPSTGFKLSISLEVTMTLKTSETWSKFDKVTDTIYQSLKVSARFWLYFSKNFKKCPKYICNVPISEKSLNLVTLVPMNYLFLNWLNICVYAPWPGTPRKNCSLAFISCFDLSWLRVWRSGVRGLKTVTWIETYVGYCRFKI